MRTLHVYVWENMSSAVRLYSSHLRWIGASIGLPTRLVRPLSSESGISQQVMGADQKTIICYHPPTNVAYHNTQPLRRQKVWEKKSLSEQEVALVKRLRVEDGFIWSVGTLSQLLQVSPSVISRVAPASEERRRELDRERQLLRNLRRHKKKLYVLQRQEVKQKKLKELLATNKYPFPETAQ